jgi:DNA replication protein DnaC
VARSCRFSTTGSARPKGSCLACRSKSLIVTTNLPFAKWSEVFLDATAAAAVIDRIVHHATVLKTEGDSYRLRTATSNRRARRRKGAR